VPGVGLQVSGVSSAAGLKSLPALAGGQFDRKRNVVVSCELQGIGYKVEGAGRMHAIESDSFRTRPRRSEFYMGLWTRDEHEDDDEGGSCRASTTKAEAQRA
jgi:hypothetical protein